MRLVKVGAGAINSTPLDWAGNSAAILACIEKARADEVSILCLPELCITGYGCEDAFAAHGTQERALETLKRIVPETKDMVVSVGLPLMHQNALLNTTCLIIDGKIAGFSAKQNLAGDGIHYEPRWFKPWPAGKRSITRATGEDIAVGDLLFEIDGIRLGFEICEDAWVAQRPGIAYARQGVDIILNPSASHFSFGKHCIRERLVIEGSRAFGVTYIYANLLGNESGRAIYDGGLIIAEAGKLIARGKRFSFAEFELTTAVVDIDGTRTLQSRTASYRPGFGTTEQPIRVEIAFPNLLPGPALSVRGEEVICKEEELTRAITLALFDYMRKSRSEGFVVSLSGGCDSSTVAALCAMMVEIGYSQLGPERFLGKLNHIRRLEGANGPKEIIARLLTCVYQATRNSSFVTRDAARVVAKGIGAQYLELDVDSLVAGYTSAVEKALGRPFDWKVDDLALQNIQARARGPSVWMIANIKNALLLATSNRSEVAVGYATMDGDTCGGLSPIAGVDKAFLRRYLAWLEKEGLKGFAPIPELSAVTTQQPTAELRPPEQNQTDENDLMPYEVLDIVERAAILDKQSPVEIFHRIRAVFHNQRPELLAAWIERFFKLWCRNQWKRERYAPSFHLDDESLDPKSWCRFPILSSGYEIELRELREVARSVKERGAKS